jgi:hypothetical protein
VETYPDKEDNQDENAASDGVNIGSFVSLDVRSAGYILARLHE